MFGMIGYLWYITVVSFMAFLPFCIAQGMVSDNSPHACVTYSNRSYLVNSFTLKMDIILNIPSEVSDLACSCKLYQDSKTFTATRELSLQQGKDRKPFLHQCGIQICRFLNLTACLENNTCIDTSYYGHNIVRTFKEGTLSYRSMNFFLRWKRPADFPQDVERLGKIILTFEANAVITIECQSSSFTSSTATTLMSSPPLSSSRLHSFSTIPPVTTSSTMRFSASILPPVMSASIAAITSPRSPAPSPTPEIVTTTADISLRSSTAYFQGLQTTVSAGGRSDQHKTNTESNAENTSRLAVIGVCVSMAVLVIAAVGVASAIIIKAKRRKLSRPRNRPGEESEVSDEVRFVSHDEMEQHNIHAEIGLVERQAPCGRPFNTENPTYDAGLDNVTSTSDLEVTYASVNKENKTVQNAASDAAIYDNIGVTGTVEGHRDDEYFEYCECFRRPEVPLKSPGILDTTCNGTANIMDCTKVNTEDNVTLMQENEVYESSRDVRPDTSAISLDAFTETKGNDLDLGEIKLQENETYEAN